MSATDVEGLLRMRVAGEESRMADLAGVLALACATDPERTSVLSARIEGRRWAVAELAARPDGWRGWHQERHAADGLVDELIGLLVTRLLRDNGVGAGIFEAAGALLDELTTAAGVPPVAVGQTQGPESMDHARGSVALRFPGSRVWELPFLAHELGHHAVPNLRDLSPARAEARPLAATVAAVAEVIAEEMLDCGRAERHAEELVADAVATVACGATYPVACLCLRTPDAAEAGASDRTHPSWHDRVATMRATLDRLSERTGLGRYRRLRRTVVDPLVVSVLGAVPEPSDAALEAGERTADAVHDHRPGLVYADADRAIEVEDALRSRDGVPPPAVGVRSVLDGAWRWRLQPDPASAGSAGDPTAEVTVEELALRYCRDTAGAVRS